MYQATANHTVRGVRVSWKMVPAVLDTRPPAVGAAPHPTLHLPRDDTPTVRAAEPFRPTQPVEVVQTRIIVRKLSTQRRVGTRVVKAFGRHSEILHPGQ